MSTLLDVWIDGALSTIFFYLGAALLFLPFAAVDGLISKKISALDFAAGIRDKKLKTIRMAASLLAAVAVGVIVGCMLQFVFHADVLQSKSLLAIVVSALVTLPVTMCFFDLVWYLKLKKYLSGNRR